MDRAPPTSSSASATTKFGPFKLFGKAHLKRDRPPTPPAKDPDKMMPFSYARYNASSPSLLNNTRNIQSPSTSSTRETFLSPSTASSSGSNLKSPGSAKFLSKFTSLGRRARNGSIVNGSGRSYSGGTSGGSSNDTHENGHESFEVIDNSSADDGSISRPWNFQHNVHVDEQFSGLPPSWAEALAERGYSPEEIQDFQRRRQQGRYQLHYTPLEFQDDDPTITLPPRSDSFMRSGSPIPEPRRPGSPFSTTLSSRSRSHSANDSFGGGSGTRARTRAPTPLRVVNPEGLQIDIDSDEERGGAGLSAVEEAMSPPPAYHPPASPGASGTNSSSPWPNDTKQPLPASSTPPVPSRPPPPPPPTSETGSDVPPVNPIPSDVQAPDSQTRPSGATQPLSVEIPPEVLAILRTQSPEPVPSPNTAPSPVTTAPVEPTTPPEPEPVLEEQIYEPESDTELPPPTPDKTPPMSAPAPTDPAKPSAHVRTRSSTFGNATTRPQPTKQQTYPPPLPLPPNMLQALKQPPTRLSAYHAQALTAPLPPSPKPLANVAALKSHFSPVTPAPELEPLSKRTTATSTMSQPSEPAPSNYDHQWKTHMQKFSESSAKSGSSIVHPYSATYEDYLKDIPAETEGREERDVADKADKVNEEEEGEGEEEGEEVAELQARPRPGLASRMSFGLPSLSPLRLSLGPITGTSDGQGGEWGKGLMDALSGLNFGDSNGLGLGLGDFSLGDSVNTGPTPQIKEPSPSASTQHQQVTGQREREQKTRSRPAELTLNLLPSASREPTEQPKFSSQSKVSTAYSVASEDPSPLWNEIMNMVNPNPPAQAPMAPDSETAPPVPPKPPAKQTPRPPALLSSQPKPVSGTTSLDVPQFITIPERRLSALRTPPPFPPPMYPPPTPNLEQNQTHLPLPLPKLSIPRRSDSAPPHSATPSLILPDLSPSRSEMDSRDESFEGDISRDSAQMASIRIAEVVRVTESKARTLLPPPSPLLPSPQYSITRRQTTPTPTLQVASSLPLPSSPSLSNYPGSAQSPVTTPSSPMPRSPVQRSRTDIPRSPVRQKTEEDEPSAIWSYLLEGEVDGSPVHESTLVGKPGSRPSTKLFLDRHARSSSPTALDQWLADDDDDDVVQVAQYEPGRATQDDSPVDPSLKGIPPPTPQRRSTQKSKRSQKSLKSNKSGKSLGSSKPLPSQSLRQAFDSSGPPAVLKPLTRYIRANADPRQLFRNMTPIAEGQYGNVFAAHFNYPDDPPNAPAQIVAVKRVSLEHTEKLEMLANEMELMSAVIHQNILVMEELYLDFSEDSIWIQMELMDRSVADILALYDVFKVDEKIVARFAADSLSAIAFLRQCGIAHRDVRSDNMLLATNGALKLGDFAHAISAKNGESECAEVVGIPYWQAPEIRKGPYNFLKIDVWGVGATVWELLEGTPPFLETVLGERWPSLTHKEHYTRSLHQFLDLCSRPAHSRPEASGLLKTDFVKSASTHGDVHRLLAHCRQLEDQTSSN